MPSHLSHLVPGLWILPTQSTPCSTALEASKEPQHAKGMDWCLASAAPGTGYHYGKAWRQPIVSLPTKAAT